MIWIHCGNVDEVPATQSLVARLLRHVPASKITVTAEPDALGGLGTLPAGVQVSEPPSDSPKKCRDFLNQMAPSYLIWLGGTLRPTLLRLCERHGLPATLINARNGALFPRASSWLPRAIRKAVAAFENILTADGATATRLTRGGVPRAQVTATGPILEEALPPPHDQYELAVLTEALGTRPVWFAADIVEAEVMTMAEAHVIASRKSHRLLMIMASRDVQSTDKFATKLRQTGLRVGVRDNGDDPEPDQQVYLVDLDELGLWLRLAPLTFIGGTLDGASELSPFDPITLGSAVVHGPRKSPHEGRYERLTRTEACREIRSAAELGIAIGQLTLPEHAARMALAGWEELTRHADQINALIHRSVDACEAKA